MEREHRALFWLFYLKKKKELFEGIWRLVEGDRDKALALHTSFQSSTAYDSHALMHHRIWPKFFKKGRGIKSAFRKSIPVESRSSVNVHWLTRSPTKEKSLRTSAQRSASLWAWRPGALELTGASCSHSPYCYQIKDHVETEPSCQRKADVLEPTGPHLFLQHQESTARPTKQHTYLFNAIGFPGKDVFLCHIKISVEFYF